MEPLKRPDRPPTVARRSEKVSFPKIVAISIPRVRGPRHQLGLGDEEVQVRHVLALKERRRRGGPHADDRAPAPGHEHSVEVPLLVQPVLQLLEPGQLRERRRFEVVDAGVLARALGREPPQLKTLSLSCWTCVDLLSINLVLCQAEWTDAR